MLKPLDHPIAHRKPCRRCPVVRFFFTESQVIHICFWPILMNRLVNIGLIFSRYHCAKRGPFVRIPRTPPAKNRFIWRIVNWPVVRCRLIPANPIPSNLIAHHFILFNPSKNSISSIRSGGIRTRVSQRHAIVVLDH